MEVHHHSHPAPGGAHSTRKKWNHHLWEFLMLFLAVFCGFLAEFYLEQKIEHHREKQFISSLKEDLVADTIELRRRIDQIDLVIKRSDSVLSFLNTYKPSSTLPIQVADQLIGAQLRLSLINTDRTSSQLKNSGGMRLIRNKKVVDHILYYWKQVEESQNSLDRYLAVRNQGRELIFKLYRIAISYSDSLRPPDQLHVIDTDPGKWNELANLVAVSRQISKGEHSTNLHRQNQLAIELIKLIEAAY